MQVHLVAFTPFIVLAGTALMAGGISAVVRVVSAAQHPARPARQPEVLRPVRSAEIIAFPLRPARVAQPLHNQRIVSAGG
jgi:hypothetical protein